MKQLLIAFVLLPMLSYSQLPSYYWNYNIGTNFHDNGYCVSTDPTDNIYFSGTYNSAGGSIDFDPGPGVVNSENYGGEDIFIVKTDPVGNFIWAKFIGGSSLDRVFDIKCDHNGDIILVGDFSNSMDADPSGSIATLTDPGNRGGFVIKLDSSGNFSWGHHFGSFISDDCQGVDIDSYNNVVITGLINGIIDLDPGPGTSTVNTNSKNCGFVLKLDQNGNYLWHGLALSNDAAIGRAVAIDGNDNIVIGGDFQMSTVFMGSSGTQTLNTIGGSHDFFLMKLSSNGTLIWVKVMGCGGTNLMRDATVDNDGNVLFTGTYSSNGGDLDPGSGSQTIPHYNLNDVIIEKLDSAGNFLWAYGIGGSGMDAGNSVYTDASNDVYLTGEFFNTMDADPGSGSTILSTSGSSDLDGFCVKLNSSGTFEWAFDFGNIFNDAVNDIAIDNNNNLILAGTYRDVVDIDPSGGIVNPTVYNGSDAFCVKYSSSVGISDYGSDSNVIIYPNPSANDILVKSRHDFNHIEIIDIRGSILYSEETSRKSINVSKLKPGIYFLKLLTDDSAVVSKFIKQ